MESSPTDIDTLYARADQLGRTLDRHINKRLDPSGFLDTQEPPTLSTLPPFVATNNLPQVIYQPRPATVAKTGNTDPSIVFLMVIGILLALAIAIACVSFWPPVNRNSCALKAQLDEDEDESEG
jgi:hypothetical protein